MPDHIRGNDLRRGELAAATGCDIETIRYYETIGLVPAPPRTAAGHRIYGASHVARLRFILRARALGFSIEEIRGLLALVDGGTPTCAGMKQRTETHLADIRARIADLARIEAVLAETAAQCSGNDVPECPILDLFTATDDVLGRASPASPSQD